MFNNVTEARGAVSRLRELQCYGSHDLRTVGICGHFEEYPNLVEKYCLGWEHYTGDEAFPVPCPDGPDPALGYLRCTDMWSGEYGRLRKDLCRHIANAIDKEILDGLYD